MSEETDKQLAAFIDIQVARIGELERRAQAIEKLRAAGLLNDNDARDRISKLEERDPLIASMLRETRGIVSRIEELEKAYNVIAGDQLNDASDTSARIRQLEIALQGDDELRAKWEAGKTGYPNIPEPSPGLVQIMALLHDSVQKVVAAQNDQLAVYDKTLASDRAFGLKLQAFFGPILEGKTPPLDGAQIATKDWVDKQIATFAGAINARVSQAVDLAKALIVQLGFADADGPDEPSTAWTKVARRLRWAYERELERWKQEQAAAARPSRLASLVFAVTGKATHNGAGR